MHLESARKLFSLKPILGALFFSPLLDCSGAPVVLTNAAPLALIETAFPPTSANPYPTAVSVAGLTGWKVAKTTVTLHGLSHTFPSDISMLLVGPHGQAAILMAQTGGQNRYSVTNLTLTLDDDAPNPLPVYTSLYSGTFRPTDGYLALGYPNFPYDFPSPAPPGNSNSPALLSTFKNTDPNGTWNLFVVDDSSGDTGSIAGGWSLSLTLAVPLQIARGPTNIVLSWPIVGTNCLLQSATTSGSSLLWSNVITLPFTNGARLVVTNPIVQRIVWFRLVGP